MDPQVAIIGTSQTKFEADKGYEDIPETVFKVVQQAMAEAGIDRDDLDTIVTSSVDLWDGRTASNQMLADVVGSIMKPESRVAGDGLGAAFQGMLTILAGASGITLVVSQCRGSMGSHNEISNWVFDPIYQQPLGLDYLSAGALQANLYMKQFGISQEDCARVVIKNRRDAQNNPYAQEVEETTVEEVMNSPMLAYPIKEMDASPVSDGACAVVLASRDKAKTLSKEPVWILGAGSCVDSHYLGDRDLAGGDALIKASNAAYSMAGISDPLKELDVAEVSAAFSYQELLWTELMGFCDRGKGARILKEGQTSLGGSLPVNPSGGMIAGNPVTVAGLTRLVEAVLQVRGKAGNRQVRGASRALSHGTTGCCGQGQYVMIVGN
ncbi:MAG: thiolase family protein [Deltaproteobacteria bacterium]|nr:thiolase family protein [Deltaproteobacteria bacterium]MBW2046928.1 thiolase family protein [Deltaproteobacteria bacterium]MBW2111508.1 thiolase family protein [Deltaproteobacteria bacterium]